MSNFAKLAIIAAFIKMFSSNSYMNICELEKMIKLAGIAADDKVMAACSLIHCIHWNTLPDEVRLEAMSEVGKMFGLQKVDYESNLKLIA